MTDEPADAAGDEGKWTDPVAFSLTLPDGREVPADGPEAEAFLAAAAARRRTPPAADEG